MNSGLKIILSIIIFICLLLLDEILRPPLFALSLSAIKTSEERSTNLRINTMKFVSDYVVNIPVVILIIPTLLVISRLKGLFVLTGSIFLTTLGGILKNLYECPRPFWVDAEVKPLDYSISFGNPSGHSQLIGMSSLLIIFVLILPNEDMNIGVKMDRDRDRPHSQIVYNNNNIWLGIKGLGSGVLLCLIPLVMYSRVYLAAHSIDQVLFGVLTAIFTIFILFYLLRETLISHFSIILQIPVSIKSIHTYFQLSNSKYIYEILKGILFYTFLTFLGIFEYIYLDTDYVIPTEYLEILRKYHHITNLQAPIKSGVVKTSLSGLGIGIYIGLYIATQIFKVDLSKWAIKTSLWNYFLRLIVIVFVMLPAALIALLFPTNTYFLKVYFRYFLCFLIGGVGLFGFTDYLCLKLKIIK